MLRSLKVKLMPPPPQVIRAFGVLKKCAAKYNMDAGK